MTTLYECIIKVADHGKEHPMTRDESIALLTGMIDKSIKARNLDKKITSLEDELRSAFDVDRKHYKPFHYFKKTLVASLIVLSALSLFAYILISIALFLVKSGELSYRYYPIFIVIIVLFIFALIHFTGGLLARKKARQMNRIEEERIESILRHKEETKDLLEKLKAQRIGYSEELGKNAALIPADLRNIPDMTNLKRLLTDNKAETLEEAVELYKSRSI